MDFQNLKTKEEAEKLLKEIEEAEVNLFRIGRRSDRMLISQTFREEAEEKGINLANPQAGKLFLEEMKEKLLNLPKVNLTLALPPPPELLKKISLVIKQTVGPSAILDIVIDKSILGGAIISFRGRYIDLSLKKKLDKFFKTYTI